MKYALAAIPVVVLAFLAAVYLFSDKTAPARTCAELHPVIVAFGDSLVAGYGAESGKGFVDDVSAAIGVPIINRGVLGNTTADGLARIDEATALHPSIVILLLGGNDALEKVAQATTEANLDAILSALTTEHVQVVLLGVQGAVLNDPYASMYESLAKKYGTQYVPNVLAGLLGHPDLMFDEVHPNAVGYAKIAARVAPAVERACAK